MKKVWQQPTLETLDIKMTMWNLSGQHPDGAWIDQIENTVQNPDGSLTMSAMS